MASITLRLDTRSIKNGMCCIRLRISHRHTSAWLNTGIFVEPHYFNEQSLYDPISKKAYMAAEKRDRITTLIRQWDEGVLELQRADDDAPKIEDMTATELKEYIFGAQKPKTKASDITPKKRKMVNSHDFMVWFDEYGQHRKSNRTQEHFAYVWRLLTKYISDKKLQCLTFSDISYNRLVDIRSWVRETGRGEATRFKVESYIRAAYREGIRMGKCDRNSDPFYDYKIEKVPEKDIITITSEQVRLLAEYNKKQSLIRARDVLMASFYLCGANFIDLYNMSEPLNGEIVFVRHKASWKTQKATRIRVEPELAEIISKYSGDGRLFNFSANLRSLQHRLDGRYRELSEELGFKVSMEIIRRTWASIAGKLEIPDRVIDKSMGHIDSSVKDRYYEQYDWNRTAKANRMVINEVLGYNN